MRPRCDSARFASSPRRARAWRADDCCRLAAAPRTGDATASTEDPRSPTTGDRPARRSCGRSPSGRGSAVPSWPRAGSSSFIASAIAKWSSRSTPAPAPSSGATATRRHTETTSGSTKGRVPCPLSPTGLSTRSAPRDSSTRCRSRRARGCGARTRPDASRSPKATSGRPARRSSRTARSSRTSEAKARGLSRSTRRPGKSCGRRPTTRPAIRPESRRRSPESGTRSS